MPYRVNASVDYLDQHAHGHSTGYCARAVRLALLAGGINIQPHPPVAKLYGQYLQRSGFARVSTTAYTPRKGDIIVLQSYPGGNPAGHIAMYDGRHWVSDFRQRDMWAGPGYRLNRPSYAIYRH